MASIQHKVTVASLAIFALAGGITGVGIWSAHVLAKNGADVNRSAEILRNHMQADMMHDALRADVLAAILASDPGTGVSMDAVKADLTEHEANFREMVAANKTLAADPGDAEGACRRRCPFNDLYRQRQQDGRSRGLKACRCVEGLTRFHEAVFQPGNRDGAGGRPDRHGLGRRRYA